MAPARATALVLAVLAAWPAASRASELSPSASPGEHSCRLPDRPASLRAALDAMGARETEGEAGDEKTKIPPPPPEPERERVRKGKGAWIRSRTAVVLMVVAGAFLVGEAARRGRDGRD